MIGIATPTVKPGHPERRCACQDALHGAFEALVADAASAGWSVRESLAALVDLADNKMLCLSAHEETDALISLLKRMT